MKTRKKFLFSSFYMFFAFVFSPISNDKYKIVLLFVHFSTISKQAIKIFFITESNHEQHPFDVEIKRTVSKFVMLLELFIFVFSM